MGTRARGAGAHETMTIDAARIAQEIGVDVARVERWARADTAPSPANERDAAA